jgi:hypothetical protein
MRVGELSLPANILPHVREKIQDHFRDINAVFAYFW